MKIRPYLHLVFWAVALGLLALFAGLGAYRSGYLATPMLGIVSAAVVLTAIWSVFGPGEYWKRFAVSHCFALGLMLLMIYGLTRRPPYYPFDGIVVGKSALLAAFALSVAAQLPLWFFRSILGWRLIHPSDQSQRPLSLRDLLFGSLIVGLAIVSAEQSGRVSAEYNSRNAWPTGAVHGEKTEMPVLGDDGVYRTTEVLADPVQIEKTRTEYVQQKTRTSLVVIGIVSILFGVISLLSVPFLRFAMLPRKLGFPYVSCVVLILGHIAIVALGYFATQRLPIAYRDIASYIPFWYGVTMIVLVTVILATRHRGFTFATDKANTSAEASTWPFESIGS